MRFENPSAFHLIWVLLTVVIISWLYQRLYQKRAEKVIGSRLYPFLTQSVSPILRKWKNILSIFAVLFFIVALARPQSGQSLQKIKSEGIELLFLLDVSESMMAEDLKPNRLEQAKAELNRLVDMMPGNKMGLIAFAGSAALLSPLTSDPGALKMYIDSASTNSVSTQGTEFQAALLAARESFERGGITQDDQVKVSRVIVVASDGEDNEEGALAEAEKLATQGVKIISIAYGTEKGAGIPARDKLGFLNGFKKDRSGQTIMTTVRGEFLKKLAEVGNGVFHFSVFGGDHIRKITETIDKFEKAQFNSEMATRYEERYQIFVVLGIICALLEYALGERRHKFKLWKGRFEVPPA